MDDVERDELKARISELEGDIGAADNKIFDLECELDDARDDIRGFKRDIAALERDIAALELKGPPLNVTQGHIIALRDVLADTPLSHTQNIEVREILDFIKGL